ncbi:MAG: serine/threonine protein kinase, partial [Blastocatellia bacterium]
MPATNELLHQGRYRIEHQFEHYGDGALFQAYDTVRAVNVVVKEVPVRHSKITSLSQQETMKVAFNNQVNSLKEIKHDGLLNVHDFFSEVGRQYVVMESVDGNDFGTLLQLNPGPFTLPETLGWADQLLDALNYLHSRNPQIIHRNITPSNVRLGADGKVRLLAFGSTGGHEVSLDSAQSDASSDAQSLNYASLEQIWDGLDAASQKVISNSYDERSERILKEPVDGRADLYSLAAFLYHLLTARKPVDALERSIDILEGKQDPLTPPHKLDASIPPEVSDVLMRA